MIFGRYCLNNTIVVIFKCFTKHSYLTKSEKYRVLCNLAHKEMKMLNECFAIMVQKKTTFERRLLAIVLEIADKNRHGNSIHRLQTMWFGQCNYSSVFGAKMPRRFEVP